MYVCVCIHVCMNVSMCVSVCIYVYMYIRIYIYIYFETKEQITGHGTYVLIKMIPYIRLRICTL